MVYNSEFVQQNIGDIWLQHKLEDYKNGSRWYKDANGFSLSLASKYNVQPFVAAGVISALSPMKSWDLNKKISERALKYHTLRGLHWYVQVKKVKKIKYCTDITEIDSILGGPKTTNFFHNIYDPSDIQWLTVDTHMSMIALGKAQKFTPKQYNFIKEEYRKFAEKIGMNPISLQASLWCTYKRVKGEV